MINNDIRILEDYIKVLRRDIAVLRYIICQELDISEEARIILEEDLDSYIFDDDYSL